MDDQLELPTRLFLYFFNGSAKTPVETLCDTVEERKQSLATVFDHLYTSWKYSPQYLKKDHPSLYTAYVAQDISQEAFTPTILSAYTDLSGASRFSVIFPQGYYNKKSGLYHSLFTDNVLSGVKITETAGDSTAEYTFPLEDADDIRISNEESFAAYPKQYTVRGYTATEYGEPETPSREIQLENPCAPVHLSIRLTDGKASLHLEDGNSTLYTNIKYHIYRKTAQSGYTEIAAVERQVALPGRGAMYKDTAASGETVYTYRVISELTFSNGKTLLSEPSNEVSLNGKTDFTIDRPFKAYYYPGNSATNGQTQKTRAAQQETAGPAFQLRWDPDPAFTGFELYRKASYGTGFRWIATLDGETVTYTDAAIESGVGYEYLLLPFSGTDKLKTYYTEAVSVAAAVPAEPAAHTPGDVDNNGEVTREDALLAMQVALGAEDLAADSAGFLAADLNEDGAVTPADVNAILRLIYGDLAAQDLPVSSRYLCKYPAQNHIHLHTGSAWPYARFTDKGELEVEIRAQDCVSLTSLLLDLSYDPELFTFIGFRDGSQLEVILNHVCDHLVAKAADEPGTVHIGFAYTDGINNHYYNIGGIQHHDRLFDCIVLRFLPKESLLGTTLSGRELGELFFSITMRESENVYVEPETADHVHQWDTVSYTANTCTEEGRRSVVCSVCGKSAALEYAARGHRWDAGTVTRPAAGNDPGVRLFKCKACGITKSTPAFEYGDVNADRSITEEDADLALRAAVGLITYDENTAAFLASDVNRSDSITPADARSIRLRALGLIPADCLPSETKDVYSVFQRQSYDPPAAFTLQATLDGDVVTVQLIADRCEGLKSAYVKLLYPSELTFLDAELADGAKQLNRDEERFCYAACDTEWGVAAGLYFTDMLKDTEPFSCISFRFTGDSPVFEYDYGDNLADCLFSLTVYQSEGIYVTDETEEMHVWGGPDVREPTCTTPGEKTLYCYSCQMLLTAVIPTVDHAWDNGTVIKPATCAADGKAVFVCAVCGETKTQRIPKLTDAVSMFIPGDVDGDGDVTSADARFTLRRAVDLENYGPGSREYLACDVDEDGLVTSADARLVLRAAVGLETFDATGGVLVDGDKAQLLAIYKTALAYAQANAGYTRSEWREYSGIHSTGVSFVDVALEKVYRSIVSEEAAVTGQVFDKGSREAKTGLPACTLTDVSKIRSAKTMKSGKNTVLILVLEDETNPMLNTSFLARASDYAPLLDRDVQPKLDAFTALTSYDSAELTCRGFTIAAEIDPDGRLVSLSQAAPEIDFTLTRAKVLVTTVSLTGFTMQKDVLYNDFTY